MPTKSDATKLTNAMRAAEMDEMQSLLREQFRRFYAAALDNLPPSSRTEPDWIRASDAASWYMVELLSDVNRAALNEVRRSAAPR